MPFLGSEFAVPPFLSFPWFFGDSSLPAVLRTWLKSNMAAALVGSQLFCPFRALGFVANHVPLTLQTQGTETLVTTAVGSAFHVYNVS